MIGFKLNKEFIKLDPGTKAAFEFNNPVFDEDLIQGDYVLPLNAPYEGNAATFGFNYETLILSMLRSYDDVGMYFKNNPLTKGVLDINSVDRKYINTSFRLTLSALNCVSKKLKEFEFGGERNLGSNMAAIIASANAIAALAYPNTDFTFPMIYHPDFYGVPDPTTLNPDFLNFINHYVSLSGGFLDNTATNRNCLVPMAFLHYVIKRGFAHDGYKVLDTGFMNDIKMQRLIIYNNMALDQKGVTNHPAGMLAGLNAVDIPVISPMTDQTFVFPNDSTLGNYDSLGSYNPVTGENIIQSSGNMTISSQLKIRVKSDPSFITPQDYVQIKIMKDGTELASQIAYFRVYGVFTADQTLTISGLNYNAAGGDVGKPLTVDMTLYAAGSQPIEADVLYGSGNTYLQVNDLSVPTTQNTFKGNFYLNDHLPDITFGELLNAIKKTFCLSLKIDPLRKEIELLYQVENMKRAYTSYEDKAVYGHLKKVTTDNTFRSFNFAFTGDDALEEDNFLAFDKTKLVGSFPSIYHLNIDKPPSATFDKRFAHVKNCNQIFQCSDPGATGTYLWNYYTDSYFDKIVNENGTVDIRPDVRSLIMYVDQVNLSRPILPYIRQLGSSDEFQLGKNPYSFRLLFYHGVVVTGSGDSYPFASSNGYAWDGVVLNDASLAWEGDLGPGSLSFPNLYKFWRNFVLINNGEFYEKRIRLALPDLQNFDINMIPRVDNANWVIKNMRVEIGDEIDEAVFLLLKNDTGLAIPPAPPTPLQLIILAEVDTSDGVSCNGRVELSAIGGSGFYLFGMVGLPENLDGVFENVCPGTYDAYVVDDLGAESHLTIVIS